MHQFRIRGFRKLFRALPAAAVAAGLATPLAVHAEHHAFKTEADSPRLEWGPCPDYMPAGCGIAVLQGDPAKPNADVLFRLPGGSTAPRHWHTSAERMVLVAGEMQVQYDGQEPFTLTSGTYAYGPAKLSHAATCRSADDCVLFIAFEEPVDAPEGEE